MNKKSIGLSANLQRSLKHLGNEIDGKITERFLTNFEQEPIIQEMYEWFQKVQKSYYEDSLTNEIKGIIEAFFDRLKEEFNISVIEEPNSIINSPSSRSRYYRFENKYSADLKFARVLRCGLKTGSKVISPCIVLQSKS